MHTSINHWYIKNVIKPTVRESGEQIKVTVMYGNEERWKAVRKSGHIRDRNGSLMLPLIMMKRTDVSKNDLSGQHFKHAPDEVSIVRTSRWSKKIIEITSSSQTLISKSGGSGMKKEINSMKSQ